MEKLIQTIIVPLVDYPENINISKDEQDSSITFNIDVHEEEKTITKKVDGEDKVETKKWKYFELGPYQYLSFQQVKTSVIEIANALVGLGLKKGDVFNIYAQTRYLSYFSWKHLAKTTAALIGNSSNMRAI